MTQDVPGRLRRRRDPRLGHDRDEPARLALHDEAGLCAPRRRGAARPAAEAGPPAVRRRDEDHRRRRGRGCRGTARPSAASWCAGPPSPRPISRPRTSTSSTTEGFFDTGDVATIDRHGYMQITDRAKDVIKSGGEWISSIDLENIAVGHPKVAEAAVIGVRHPKWDERPLLVIVLKKDQSATSDEILGFMEGKIAKWWMPDDVVFVDEIPHTATGKIKKMALRETLQGLHAADRGRGRVGAALIGAKLSTAFALSWPAKAGHPVLRSLWGRVLKRAQGLLGHPLSRVTTAESHCAVAVTRVAPTSTFPIRRIGTAEIRGCRPAAGGTPPGRRSRTGRHSCRS